MDIFQLLSLPFYLLVTIVVFFIANSKLVAGRYKFFSYILIALLVLAIVGLITGVFGPQIFGFKTSNLIIPVVTFVSLLSLTVALVRLRIFSPGFIFYKIVAWVSLILVLGIAFTALISIFDLFLASFAQFRQFLVATMLAVIAILVFQPVRFFLERTLGQIFFPNQTNIEKLESEINLILEQDLEISDLATKCLEKIIKFTNLTGAGIILFEDGKPSFSRFADLTRPKSQDITRFSRFTQTTEFQDRSYTYTIPLIFRRKNAGVLIMGKRLTGPFFAIELVRLEKIATKITVPLVQAHAFEELDKFNLKLTQIAEKSAHELTVAKQKLAQINKMKDEFVSVTSHELRTPLTGIKSYLWMALSGRAGQVSDKLSKYLNLAYRSTERMIKLVNDLLNISKIESGEIEVYRQGVNIVNLVKTVISEVEEEAKHKGLTIEIEQKDLPLVFADANRIHEVLINLIGNSLKFTPPSGKIKVSFNQKDNFIETAVQDTGKGISPNDMPRLFHKFGLKTGSLTATRETGGSGLGLYICKSLVALHGGKIWAESKLGLGSTFTFSLPAAKKDQLERFGVYEHEEKIRQVEGSLVRQMMQT